MKFKYLLIVIFSVLLWNMLTVPIFADSKIFAPKPRTDVLLDIEAHDSGVNDVIFTPDGKHIVSASADGLIKLWDSKRGNLIREYRGHTAPVHAVDVSSDGSYIASASFDRTVRIWHLDSGRQVRKLSGHTAHVLAVSFSNDGRYLLSGGRDNRVLLWDIDKGEIEKEFTGHTSIIYAVAFCPVRGSIYSGSWDKRVISWDAETGQKIDEFMHSDPVTALSLSSDGNYLITGGHANTLSRWNVNTGQELETFEGHTAPVLSVDYSYSGDFILSSSMDNTAIQWATSTGNIYFVFERHSRPVTAAELTKCEELVLTAGRDQRMILWKPDYWIPEHATLSNRRYYELISSLEKKTSEFQEKVEKHYSRKIEELLAPQGEFETDRAYQSRLEKARRDEEVIIEEVEQEVKSIIDELRARCHTAYENYLNDLDKYIEVDIDIVRYDPNDEVLYVRVLANNEVIPFDLELEHAEPTTERLRRHIKQRQRQRSLASAARANFQPIVSKKVGVKSLTIEGLTGMKRLVYRHEEVPSEAPVGYPPYLVVSDPIFSDSGGDERLSAGERAFISFSVENQGQGLANNVRVVGVTNASIDGLNSFLGNIPPGEKRSTSLTITGKEDLEDGLANIVLNTLEGSGFHAEPVGIIFRTVAYRSPELLVHDIGVENAEGTGYISHNQVVDITTVILNTGEGIAHDVDVTIRPGENIFLAGTSEPERTYSIGSLEAGTYHEIRFQAYSNREAEEFAINLSAIDRTGKYRIDEHDLGLEFYERQRTIREITIDPVYTPMPVIPSFITSIEQNIPQASEVKQDAVAVIIGNCSYRNENDVAFANRDAGLVRRYVEECLGYRPGNILYFENATLSDLKVTFGDKSDPGGRLRDIVKEGVSELFIYYSGHGAPDPNTMTGYLLPVDADANRLALSAYPLELLYRNLRKLDAKNTTIVIDACFSGTTGAGDMLIKYSSPIGIEIEHPILTLPNSAVFTASKGSQIASWHLEKKHGLFTYLFLKGLQGEADLNGDGHITVAEMREYLLDSTSGVPYLAREIHNREQTPEIWGQDDMVLR